MVDKAFATSLSEHIRNAYAFLMDHCTYIIFSIAVVVHELSVDAEGDKIYIFGFSRGAYAARALAGMVHKVN